MPRLSSIATPAMAALLLSMAVRGSAVAEESPYPVWWSESLELESLDVIDARLERELRVGDDQGLRLMRIEGETWIMARAVNCIELESWVEAGYRGVGHLGYSIQIYQLARCHAIEMLRQAMPARRSFLWDFRLDMESVNYFPAIVNLSLSCEMMCRDAFANERRISLSLFHEVSMVEILSETELKYQSLDWRMHLTILALADFNRDGIEDMLILSSGGPIIGRGTWADIFVLARDAPDAVLYGLNYDKPAYWQCQCDESYDDPAVLRETNPARADPVQEQ